MLRNFKNKNTTSICAPTTYDPSRYPVCRQSCRWFPTPLRSVPRSVDFVEVVPFLYVSVCLFVCLCVRLSISRVATLDFQAMHCNAMPICSAAAAAAAAVVVQLTLFEILQIYETCFFIDQVRYVRSLDCGV